MLSNSFKMTALDSASQIMSLDNVFGANDGFLEY